MIGAARSGRLPVVQWLDANGLAQVTEEAFLSAVAGGRLNYVVWMLPRLVGERFSDGLMDYAICEGTFEMMLTLYADGRFPGDSDCFRCALGARQWQVFQ